ncbi:MAG: hypothetical protein A2Y76_09045 [Planctomycetes bacterium RBG_13_60_9]|nr:MAG: hypothetical protein A2Y76_09045 [Planctomycetes bacterium RBG_13_60_9]
MWEIKEPRPVKLIVGILAADERCLTAARDSLSPALGAIDLASDVWTFDQTDYYASQIGPEILRQFISIEPLIDPGRLAAIKHQTNRIEQRLAATLATPFPRPVNLDPGIIEPSKLVLATTKNYAHRIYIGDRMYAEVTLIFDKGQWCPLPYTYPDYRRQQYVDFFSEVRTRLVQQLKSQV